MIHIIFYYDMLIVMWKYKGNFYEKKKVISDDWELPNLAKKKAKNLAFLYSSILYLFKATAMPNLRAVTLYLVEFLWLLVFVSKSVTFVPSLYIKINIFWKKGLINKDC